MKRSKWFSGGKAKRKQSRRDPRRRLSVEPLENRKLLAVVASFAAQTGQLTVIGDSEDNVVTFSRANDGTILVNNGDVAVQGGTPTVNNTNTLVALGLGGNDQLALNETNGALPRAYLLGGAGNDMLIGGSGEDYLSGSSGNDLLRGGDNADQLFGGTGNDTLLGDRGNDDVEGQDGSDLLIWNNGDGSDVMEGGAGFDFVQVNGANGAGDDFSIDPNGERVRFQRNNLGLFTLDIGTTENLDVNGQGGSDVIIGSVGLVGLIDLDLDGGEGNDLLIGGDGVDVLRGGAGNDTLIGGRGNDVVLGQDGSDLLIWNNGDGSDFMEGGAGFDFVQVNGSNTAGDDFSIDPNGQRVRFQRNNLGLFTLDIGTTENLDVNGQGGSDVIVGSKGLNGLIGLDLDGGEGNDLLIGGDGVDVLRGGAGNDTLIGGRGNDVMLGQDGSDLLIWNHGDGSDFMEGGEGFDFVQVNGSNTAGDDFSIDPNGERVRFRRNNLSLFTLNIGTTENLDVNGQGGSDVIVGSTGLNGLIGLDLDGGEGNDLLIGGDGVDVIRGGAGNDTLIGGRGNDVMLGQNGSDLLIWNNGDGSDFMEGGEGFDFVQVNGANGAGDSFRVDPNGERVRFRRTNLALFTLDIGTTENLDVNGQGGSDVIIGSTGLVGLIGLDLDGGEGNDLLIGGDGADVLRGGAGNDTLLGGRGNDIVLGQDGDDLLLVNDGDGSDFLEGGAGNDTVQVNGSNTAGDTILVSPNGNRVRLERTNLNLFTLDIGTAETIDINTLAGNDRVTGSAGLAGLTKLDIDGGIGIDILTGGDGDDRINGGADTDLILGRDGNDTLIGNQGNDFVFGENGNDLIVVNEGDGNDLIEGGLGRDTVQITTADGSNVSGVARESTTDATDALAREHGLDPAELGWQPQDDRPAPEKVPAGRSQDLTALTKGLANNQGKAKAARVLKEAARLGLDQGAVDEVFKQLGSLNKVRKERSDPGEDPADPHRAAAESTASTASVTDAAAGGDEINIRANGRVARVERTNGDVFALNIGSSEVIDLRTRGGDDRVTIENLTGVQDLVTLTVDTGDGDDVLNASNLTDAAFALIGRGGEGNDILFGGAGNDVLLGEEGRDIIIANDGNDFVSGGVGNDILISGDGNDVIVGGDGNDVLSGGAGNDILLAGDGNDTLNGGADIDFLDGGAGEDSAINGETVINVP